MIKRAIILILILAGLYWLTSTFRDGNKSSIQKEVEKKVEDTVSTEKKGDDIKKVDTEKKEEASKNEAKKETEKTTKPAEKNVKSEVKKEKEVKAEKNNVTTKKSVAKIKTRTVLPVAKRTYKPVVKKTPQPTIPDRTTYVKVYVYEWGVDLSSKEIPSGTVIFTVMNSGRFSHDFTIKGLKDFGKVPPRQTASFTAKVPAGNYEIFSGRRDDAENGMTEGITVVK